MLNKDPKVMAEGVLGRAFGDKALAGGHLPPPIDSSEKVPGYDEPDLDEGQMMAAEEMMSAFHSKDHKKLASSMKAFVDQCYREEDVEMEG